MSRAITISVAIVSGFSVVTSSAQAASRRGDEARARRQRRARHRGARQQGAARQPATSAGNVPFRCFLLLLACFSAGWRGGGASAVSSVTLEHLDLVSVRVGDEEEAREQRAVAVELDDLARRQPGRLEAGVLGVEVVDDEGDVAVAVAERIGLGPPLVDGELDLEVGLGVAQVDEGEGVEVEPVRGLEPEGARGRSRPSAPRRARGSSCGSPWPCLPPLARRPSGRIAASCRPPGSIGILPGRFVPPTRRPSAPPRPARSRRGGSGTSSAAAS